MLDPVNPLPVWRRHRALRWFAPVVVVGAIALVASGAFDAGAASSSARLPRTTPAALLAKVQAADVSGYSGTLVSSVSLGLPDVQSLSLGAGASSSLSSLAAGSHTLQVWYGGADRQRVALFGSTDETDLFHDGRNLWQWSSADHTAVHVVLPATRTGGSATSGLQSAGAGTLTPASPGALAGVTPSALAKRVLGTLDPTTAVRVVSGLKVADRSAYELVLTPRAADTLVGSIRIAVDGATKLPLGVQVFARGARQAAVDVSFSSIRFDHPSDRLFAFTPPPGATVRTVGRRHNNPSEHGGSAARRPAARPAALHASRPTVSGAGWSRIVSAQAPKQMLRRLAGTPVWQALTPVSGTWGSGRLLRSTLLSALVTDSGRIYAGAVDPAALYAAAGAK